MKQSAVRVGADEQLPREIDLGPEDAIPLGQGREFVVAGATVAIFRQRDGRLFAIDGVCPHRGGPLAEGVVGDGKVVCPLHALKFDLTTGRCLGGDAGAVRVHFVRREAGRLRLSLVEA